MKNVVPLERGEYFRTSNQVGPCPARSRTASRLRSTVPQRRPQLPMPEEWMQSNPATNKSSRQENCRAPQLGTPGTGVSGESLRPGCLQDPHD